MFYFCPSWFQTPVRKPFLADINPEIENKSETREIPFIDQ